MGGLNELLGGFLSRPRFEVIPAKGTEQAVAEWVPAGMTVTVTASPVKGLEPTIELAEKLAGPAERSRLLRMAAVAGASESARFITRHPGWILRFWVPGGYSPDRLLDRAAPVITAPDAGVAGLHLFTFNQLQQAEQWRRAALERTGIDHPQRLAG